MKYFPVPIAISGCLISAVFALPSPSSFHSEGVHDGQCHTFTVPVPVKATAVDFGLPPLTDRFEVTQWAVSSSTWSALSLANIAQGNVSVDETFNIFGQLCIPHNGAKKNILHLATHGIAFDSR